MSCPLATAPCQGAPAPATAEELAKAVAEMRNVPARLVGGEAQVRGERLSAAWQTLAAAQDAGAKALPDEAARLAAAKQKDDRFRLGAGRVVWEIGHFDRVADVLDLWGDADFAVKYSYAFEVGLLAARDGDERSLPLLVALLRDQRGTLTVRHATRDRVVDHDLPLTRGVEDPARTAAAYLALTG